jgi:sugar phosphate permease
VTATEPRRDVPARVARMPPAARLLPRRFFYGWYVAVACSGFMFVGVGVAYYGLAVFLRPLQDAHGWSNSAVSGATGLFFSVSGITGAIVGPRIDRHGPFRFMTVGTILMGVAVALIGHVDSLWQLYADYVMLAVAFGMATTVSVNAIMTRWFVTLRARAMSVSSTGISVGGVLLAPFGSTLIDAGGLELATPVMGALILAVGLPLVILVIAFDPRDMGLEADGGRLPARVRAPLTAAAQQRVWTLRDAVRTVPFWAVLVAFLLVLTAQTGFVIHQISFLEDRLGSRSAAALALSTTAFGSIVARLVVGTFADAIDKRALTVLLLAVQATAVLLVIPIESRAATYALILVFGFTIGNVYMMQSLLVGEIFGMVSFGAVFGLVNLASYVGSGFGPLFVGWLEDVTGSYSVPFTVTAIATYAAALAVLLARPLTAEDGAAAAAAAPAMPPPPTPPAP